MKFLRKLQNFEDGEDIERWIDRFELAVHVDDQKTSEASLLPMFLSGSAYDTWKNLSHDEKADAKHIKEALRKSFGISRQRAWRNTRNLNLDRNMNIDVAIEEIKRNLKIVIGDRNPMEAIAAMLLLDSLPGDLRDECILRLDENFELTDLQSLIKKKREHNENVVALIGTSKGDGLVRCAGCKRTGHIQQNCRVKCFRCDNVGHIKANCKSELKDKGE